MDIKDINFAIDQIWLKLKGALIGNSDTGKALLITSSSDPLSLPGIFDEAIKEAGGDSDLETLNGLLNITDNYLSVEKAKLKAKLFHKMKTLENGIEGLDTAQAMLYLDEEIQKILDESKMNLTRISVSETQSTKQTAFLDGILKTNAHFGVEDPTIIFLTTKNPTTVCSECRRLHCMDNDLDKPRPWKLSQLSLDYAGKHPTVPHLTGLHPNCRLFNANDTSWIWNKGRADSIRI